MKHSNAYIFKLCKSLSEGQYFENGNFNQYVKNPCLITHILENKDKIIITFVNRLSFFCDGKTIVSIIPSFKEKKGKINKNTQKSKTIKGTQYSAPSACLRSQS